MADSNDQRANGIRRHKQPRSREGCQTCRSRKVKCDEERPQCRACVRLNRECIWERFWMFRDESTTVAQGYTVLGSRPKKAGEVTSIDMSDIITMSGKSRQKRGRHGKPSLAEPDDLISSSWSASRSSSSEDDAVQVELLYQKGSRIRPSINTAGSDRAQALITALSHYLPLDEMALQSSKLEDWPTMSFLSPYNNALINPRVPVLTATVDALSLTLAAVKMQDDRLAQQAIKTYTISVALLRRSIAGINDYNRNEVLLAIMILQITEAFRPISQAGGWLTHVDGAAKIFQYEGPRHLSSSYDAALFSHARQYAIMGAIMRREHTFFSQPQWLAMSRSAPSANSMTRLLDIASSIPGMLVETDEIRSKAFPEHVVHRLLRKLYNTSEAIITWIDEFRSSTKHEVSITFDLDSMEAYNLEMDGDSTFLPVYKFASFRTAFRITMGWAFHYTVLKAIHNILTTREDISYKLKASKVELEMLRVVTNLSKVIPQFFARYFGTIGRAAIMVPLAVSTEFYVSRGQAKELSWCQRVGTAIYSPREGLIPIRMPD